MFYYKFGELLVYQIEARIYIVSYTINFTTEFIYVCRCGCEWT